MSINYISLLIYIIFLIILCFILYSLSAVYTYLNFKKKNDLEKRSPYECGFNAFNDARSGYYINFYLISLLYILFDLEITLLFPYCLSLYFQNIYTFIIIFVFLILLGLNFLYEFKVGALQWK